MNPLNDMHDALISINSILQKRKHTSEEICVESTVINKRELLTDPSHSLNITNTNVLTSELKSTADANENNHNQLHYELLTEDNFHRAHLCNRSIDELPSTVLSSFNRKNHHKTNIFDLQS